MKKLNEIKKTAKKTIETEAFAIKELYKSINDDFAKCVELIYNSTGRIVITGIGKSAIIATKIVSTLNSTGTPAIFMHAADAIHGDLGIIQSDDIVICISKSGETPEIKILIPLLKSRGNKLIALAGNMNSYLAKQADYYIDVSVEKEACPNNLAPTSSTTAQLVMGDALAVCLLECKGFTEKDFAKYHPGGALGKKLYLRASDIFIQNEKPYVDINENINEVILEISSKRLGATIVLENNKVIGIITDGDLRRMLHNNTDISNLKAVDIMSKNPKIIQKDELLVEILDLMRKNNITQVPVCSGNSYVGIVHLHDILKEGIL
ncbi:MAG: KpsF/GutQ family sugar-phosphate isomerase [Bacteroidales bacterium]|nr:KpsF/GutQ family sugar-phosphate isomerase [Bacteroidales bacterium]